MIVRRLNVSDEALAYVALKKLKNEIPPDVRAMLNTEYLHKFLSCERNYFLTALIDEQPVGFILAYCMMRVDRAQDMMLLYEIGVDEKNKKQAVGTSLIKELKRICRENKIMKMWVLTNKSNQAATRLYQRTGGIEDDSGDEVSFTYLPDFE